ncbi:hypothetical protein J8273_3739 [Carpediemonas membranifera]|uniref:Uncharacterized protein n=1 Tax=Carpediemonas membranifera TaxID=201153 RepID=A0A8J6E2J4_9EUKA|nr:hypothetical protein J8273_3739 [Carpediemonas membranifera]|eukprot:KAG9394763.1 hypothetical protein J8273_3739 [Carpediemonas membranifera]
MSEDTEAANVTQNELNELKNKVTAMEHETYEQTGVHVKTSAMLRKLLSDRGQHFDSAEFVLTRIKKGHKNPFELGAMPQPSLQSLPKRESSMRQSSRLASSMATEGEE